MRTFKPLIPNDRQTRFNQYFCLPDTSDGDLPVETKVIYSLKSDKPGKPTCKKAGNATEIKSTAYYNVRYNIPDVHNK